MLGPLCCLSVVQLLAQLQLHQVVACRLSGDGGMSGNTGACWTRQWPAAQGAAAATRSKATEIQGW